VSAYQQFAKQRASQTILGPLQVLNPSSRWIWSLRRHEAVTARSEHHPADTVRNKYSGKVFEILNVEKK
jgi:hypothetical protein